MPIVFIKRSNPSIDRLARPQLPKFGNPSPRYGHLGMWNYCLGPNSPIPGERLIVLILDQQGEMVRRFEQIRGQCTEPGYVDFFNSPMCRPAVHQYPLVDFSADGKEFHVLCPHYTENMGMDLYLNLLKDWAYKYGRPEWGFNQQPS